MKWLWKVSFKAGDLFLSGKPAYHLWEFIALIGGTPSVFGKVDMKALKHLCVVVVGSSKEFDGFNVVEERMEFWNIEILLNECCDESGTYHLYETALASASTAM